MREIEEKLNSVTYLSDPGDRYSREKIFKKLQSCVCDTVCVTLCVGHHETYDQFKARLKRTAFSLPPEVINKGMASMKRRCVEVDRTGGEWIKGD